MKKKNLKKLGNVIKDIINTLQSLESNGVVFCPKSIIDRWQHDLFSILSDEQNEKIGKLLREKDFSIDVENEIAEHDEKVRDDEREKVIKEFERRLKLKFVELPLDDLIVLDILKDIDEIVKQMKGAEG